MNIVFIFYLIGVEICNCGNEKLLFEFVLELMFVKIKIKVGLFGFYCIRLCLYDVILNSSNSIKEI